MNPKTLKNIKKEYPQVGDGSVEMIEDTSESWERSLSDDVEAFNRFLFFIDSIHVEIERREDVGTELPEVETRALFIDMMLQRQEDLIQSGEMLNTEGVVRMGKIKRLSAFYEKVLCADDSYEMDREYLTYQQRGTVASARLISNFYRRWGDQLQVDTEEIEDLVEICFPEFPDIDPSPGVLMLQGYLGMIGIDFEDSEQIVASIRNDYSLQVDHWLDIERGLRGMDKGQQERWTEREQEKRLPLFRKFLRDYILLKHFQSYFPEEESFLTLFGDLQ